MQRKEGFGAVTAKLLVPGVLTEMHAGGNGGGDMMPTRAASSARSSLDFEDDGEEDGLHGRMRNEKKEKT